MTELYRRKAGEAVEVWEVGTEPVPEWAMNDLSKIRNWTEGEVDLWERRHRGFFMIRDTWLCLQPGNFHENYEPVPEGPTLPILYRNHRGEIGIRNIRPLCARFRSTKWHPEPQWMMLAHDADKHAEREFAMRDIAAVIPPELRQDVFDAIVGIYGEPVPAADARGALADVRRRYEKQLDDERYYGVIGGMAGHALAVLDEVDAALARMGGGNGD